MTGRNAIAAATHHIANQYLDAFGLQPKEWEVMSFDNICTTQQHDRMVVIRPHWRIQDHDDFESKVQMLRCRVPPGGSFKVI